MIKLYHSTLSRSMRILWLLEELEVPYELVKRELTVPIRPYSQDTPTGKFPTIEDDGMVMFESIAIAEYILERYGNGRLAPAPSSSERGPFLQWMHFAEATAFVPVAVIAWHKFFRHDAERIPEAIADYETWAHSALDQVEKALEGRDHLLASGFSAADVMLGYTLQTAKFFDLLTDRHPRTCAYFARLMQRPAFQKAMS
ncbi:MAG TPA: glutathione S-transferase family protein [Candidatus Limnocylindrales bacterium]|nr:glutathione S-transferase family protein [Candidatus Limnocylindrales bacterium]